MKPKLKEPKKGLKYLVASPKYKQTGIKNFTLITGNSLKKEKSGFKPSKAGAGHFDGTTEFANTNAWTGPVLRLEDLVAAAKTKPARQDDEITTSSCVPSFRDLSGRENKSPLISFRH